MFCAKQEGIIVICDNTIYKALRVKPGALRLSLSGRNDVGQPKQLQQLLAVPIHVRGWGLCCAHLLPVRRLQLLLTMGNAQ